MKPWLSLSRSLWFKLNPFRCDRCGTRLSFDEFQATCHSMKQPLMIMAEIIDQEKTLICGHCLAMMIREQFWSLEGTSRHQKCEICEEIRPCRSTLVTGNLKVRFGSKFWNGSHVCVDCLSKAAEEGVRRSSVAQFIGSSLWYQNSKGIMIDVEKEHQKWLLVLAKKSLTHRKESVIILG